MTTLINENKILEGTYIITMQTKTDKTLFLTMHTTNGKPAWTFDKQDACIWENDILARKFAKKWFKHFNGWAIREYRSMRIEKEIL